MPRAVTLASLALVAGCGRIGFDPVPNRAFVTSTAYPATAVANADDLCAQHATAAGLPGTFIAYVGTSGALPYSRIASSRGWRLVDDSPLANEPADLETRSILGPAGFDETGTDIRAAIPVIWTGLHSDGPLDMNCQDWTTTVATALGEVGDTRTGGAAATHYASYGCDQTAAVLCLEIGHVATVAPTRAPSRHAFVSARAFVANPGGIASADALCTEEAQRASLPGTYLALLPQPGVAAMSRFDLSGLPWARSDGMLLAPTPTELFTAPFLTTFLDRTADGTALAIGTLVWSRAPADTTATACTDWTDPATAALAALGDPFSSVASQFFSANSTVCTDANRHVVCLQE
jgi:hypothetical protein